MIEFDIRDYTPRFLWNDKTGRALAKAIEAGLKYCLARCQEGIDCIIDVEKMPEWRLDELAREYNIPYDYAVDAAVKREWIGSAYALSRLYGTSDGIDRFMRAYYNGAIVEENWDYGGEPFHFRLVFPGGWTPERIAWANRTVPYVKNVRSVLDGYVFSVEMDVPIEAGIGLQVALESAYDVAEETIQADYYTDEAGEVLLDEGGIPLIVEV